MYNDIEFSALLYLVPLIYRNSVHFEYEATQTTYKLSILGTYDKICKSDRLNGRY